MDRRHPAQALFHCPRDQRCVGDERSALVRVLVQDEGAPRQQGPRRLVARHQQRQEEHEQLLLAQRAPSDLAAHEERDEIVPRSFALGPDVLDDESGELAESRHGLAGGQVGRLDRRVGPARETPPGPTRRSREAPRSRSGGTVPPARRRNRSRPGDRTSSSSADGAQADRLGKARHGPRCEASVDQPTEGGVLGRIHVEDGTALHRSLAGLRNGSFTNAPRPEQKWPGSRLRFRMSS